MKNMKIHKADPIPKKDEPDPAGTGEFRNGVSITVNPPFRGAQYASNKKLTPEDIAKLEKAISQEERLQFVVIGDLNIKSRYARSMFAVTDKLIYGFDEGFEGGMKIHTYDRVKRAYVKRYYGNAMLIFSMDESEKEFVDLTKEYTNFVRFSYKEASLFDAVANFITNVAAGKNIADELTVIEAAFDKHSNIQQSVTFIPSLAATMRKNSGLDLLQPTSYPSVTN